MPAASGQTSPAQAAARAEKLTREASSSFYWAMRLMPARERAAMFAVYAFCRVVDDIADDPRAAPEEKSAALAAWEARIADLYAGRPDHWIALALSDAVEAFDLRRTDFLDVIAGMRMDAEGPLVAPSMAELDLYCDRAASAVGRLSVRIFGERGDAGLKLAHHQGRALQLANILRDVAEDARMGRLYLPRELLEKHRIDWRDPGAVMGQPGFVPLWRELAEKTEGHFEQTRRLFSRCRGDMRPARVMLAVYARNFQRMRALSDAQLADPGLSTRLTGKGEKLFIALRAWLGGRA